MDFISAREFDIAVILLGGALTFVTAYYVKKRRTSAEDALEEQPDDVSDRFYEELSKASFKERAYYQLYPSRYIENYLKKVEIE